MENIIKLSANRRPGITGPLIMGILNVTPDSFSDGGKFARFEAAVAQAMQMQNEGADIIDIGGESSRPGAEPVTAEDEMERVLPVIKEIRRLSAIPISIDTYKAATAQAALEAGANIVNDISALRFDPAMVDFLARTDVPVILMHMLGTPRDMQQNPTYTDCVKEIGDFFAERIEFCRSRDIGKERIIIDPGIGFGKRLEDNLAILRELEQFKRFGLPLLVGASRKSFIGKVAPSERTAGERLGGSIAAAVVAALHGADIIRVHDVAETVEALKVARAIREM